VVAGLRIGRLFKREVTQQQLLSEIEDEIGKNSEASGPASAIREMGALPAGKQDLPVGWKSRTGIIREAVGTPEGTHQLINEEGKVLILLEAHDAKLKVSEGMEAEVQGPVRGVEDSALQLMTVERVVFR